MLYAGPSCTTKQIGYSQERRNRMINRKIFCKSGPCLTTPWKHPGVIIIIIDKTDAGLNGLCIRDITLIYDVINTYNNY